MDETLEGSRWFTGNNGKKHRNVGTGNSCQKGSDGFQGVQAAIANGWNSQNQNPSGQVPDFG
jgi:hypothetical protein